MNKKKCNIGTVETPNLGVSTGANMDRVCNPILGVVTETPELGVSTGANMDRVCNPILGVVTETPELGVSTALF